MPKQTKLPDGEFFVIDEDTMADVFSSRGEYDPDPKETVAIKKCREVYYRTFEPDWAPSPVSGDDLFHRHYPLPPPMPANLVHQRIGYKRPKPKKEPNHFLRNIVDYASPSDCYIIVSPEWRAAIESVEKVHEFFPLDVVFADAIWPRYIFRDRQNITFLDPPESTTRTVPMRGKRRLVAGHHWVRHRYEFECFTSRELALLLLPILPSTMRFRSVPLTDDVAQPAKHASAPHA